MDMQRGNTPAQLKTRRFGKKVIFCHRVAPALGAVPPPVKKESWFKRLKSFRPSKKQLVIFAAALLVIGMVTTVSILLEQKRQADVQAAAAAETARVEKENAAAQECYKQKVAEKADIMDKLTYDQLYDGDSCLTQ